MYRGIHYVHLPALNIIKSNCKKPNYLKDKTRES